MINPIHLFVIVSPFSDSWIINIKDTSVLNVISVTELYFASKFECLAELMDKKIDVYFAGALFSSKDLIGNCMLAESIEEISDKYRIVSILLPPIPRRKEVVPHGGIRHMACPCPYAAVLFRVTHQI